MSLLTDFPPLASFTPSHPLNTPEFQRAFVVSMGEVFAADQSRDAQELLEMFDAPGDEGDEVRLFFAAVIESVLRAMPAPNLEPVAYDHVSTVGTIDHLRPWPLSEHQRQMGWVERPLVYADQFEAAVAQATGGYVLAGVDETGRLVAKGVPQGEVTTHGKFVLPDADEPDRNRCVADTDGTLSASGKAQFATVGGKTFELRPVDEAPADGECVFTLTLDGRK